MKHLQLAIFLTGIMTVSTASAQFDGPGIGFFHAHSDVGSPAITGYATYRSEGIEPHRKILDGAEGSWQAFNWTPDGRYLIYNADGLLYKYDLKLRNSRVLPTGKY